MIEAFSTDAIGIGPYLCIVDEYAANVTPGFEVVLTQGRGLGIAAVVTSQDYAGILEADKKARSKWRPMPPLKFSEKFKYVQNMQEIFRQLF